MKVEICNKNTRDIFRAVAKLLTAHSLFKIDEVLHGAMKVINWLLFIFYIIYVHRFAWEKCSYAFLMVNHWQRTSLIIAHRDPSNINFNFAFINTISCHWHLTVQVKKSASLSSSTTKGRIIKNIFKRCSVKNE